MSTISQIRAGLKTRLETITTLRVSGYVTHRINIGATKHQAMIGHVRRTYHETFGTPGDSHIYVDVIVLVGTAGEDVERAQADLDLYCEPSGTSSVVGAIEGDQTLGGIVDSLEVRDVSQGTIEISGVEYIAGTFTCEIYT